MSHFTVYVFTKPNGPDWEELLVPYDENLATAPYIKYTKEQAIAAVRKEIEEYKNSWYAEYLKDPAKYEAECHNPDHIKYLKEEFPKRLNWRDEECYQQKAEWFDEDRIDEEGNLWSTYNPNSKWDWYVVGGRWDGALVLKDGEEENRDCVGAIDWKKTGAPFAFISPDGIWHEKGEMGWWACVSNEKTDDSWDKEFFSFVDSLDENVTVTLVDCHI